MFINSIPIDCSIKITKVCILDKIYNIIDKEVTKIILLFERYIVQKVSE